MDFVHEQLPGRIVFGPGRRHDLPAELEALDASAALIIGGSHDLETVEELVQRLPIPSETIIGVRAHVPSESVRLALQMIDRFAPNTVVTIGGGSATGLGKMIALQRVVELVAVPTTYAGSEMTPIWGTTDNGVKTTGRSTAVLPTTVVYDPELTLSLPKDVTVNSAFNALAHVVEALWLPDTSPITGEMAAGAIATIMGGLEEVATRSSDLDARARLLYGANRAGAVLASAGTGLLHKTAHVLGGMFDLDHGAMYAVLTPHMVGHHLDTSPAAHARLTRALGSDPQRRLNDLGAQLGAPRSLADLGFPADGTRAAAEAVAEQAPVGVVTIETLLRDAGAG